jgi:hypothetical protein
MTEGDALTTLQWVAQAGLIPALLIAIWGAIKEWWVPGKTYRRALDDADKWRALALRGSGIAEKAVELAEADI